MFLNHWITWYVLIIHVCLPYAALVAAAWRTQRKVNAFRWAPTRLDTVKWEQAGLTRLVPSLFGRVETVCTFHPAVLDHGYDPTFDAQWSAWCAAEMEGGM